MMKRPNVFGKRPFEQGDRIIFISTLKIRYKGRVVEPINPFGLCLINLQGYGEFFLSFSR